MMTTTTETLEAGSIRLRHEVLDTAKYEAMVEEMEEGGWTGRPVVVYRERDGRITNITGCHRISAAATAGVDVDAVVIDASDEDVLDAVEYAAAISDDDAADAVREVAGGEIADLVRMG